MESVCQKEIGINQQSFKRIFDKKIKESVRKKDVVS
jgi:hypothetical protein